MNSAHSSRTIGRKWMLAAMASAGSITSVANAQWTNSSGNAVLSNPARSVGIGTAPSHPLHLSANSTFGAYFRNSMADSTAVFGYGVSMDGDVKGIWGYSEAPYGTGVLGQAVSNTGLAVGVRGLSSADNGYGGYFSGRRFGIYSEVTGTGYAAFLEGTTYVSANLGIGTTNPLTKVHVYGFAAPAELRLETNTGTGNSALTFAHSTNRSPYVGMDFDEAGDTLRLRTNNGGMALNGTALAIKRTTNKVGFQTENPKSRLQIGVENGSGGYRNWMSEGLYTEVDSDGMYVGLKSEGGNRQDSIIAFGDDTTDNLRFIFSPPGLPTVPTVTEVMRISGTQKVAIGTTFTTSAHKLVIQNDNNASVWIRGTNGNNFGSRLNFGDLLGADGINGYVYLHEDTDDHLRIQANNGVHIQGSLSKSGGSFIIDHPTDPANKYLYHSFVESPDMMNIYNGNVVTDAQGFATITLPDYFEALNKDFRYQLTVIEDGGAWSFARVTQKVRNGQFTIQTSTPNVEVSWQVTGIRQDAWANARRIPNAVDKEPENRGKYLYPELFGATPDKAITAFAPPGYVKQGTSPAANGTLSTSQE